MLKDLDQRLREYKVASDKSQDAVVNEMFLLKALLQMSKEMEASAKDARMKEAKDLARDEQRRKAEVSETRASAPACLLAATHRFYFCARSSLAPMRSTARPKPRSSTRPSQSF